MRGGYRDLAATRIDAWVVAASLIVVSCGAGPHQATERLDPAACRPAASEETRGLHEEWGRFLSYVQACEVKDDAGKAVLVVLTVSATHFYEKLPSGAETVALPKPLITTPEGEVVGSLPFAFPDDPPFALQVTFADWTRGWPHRIALFVKDPTVTGDHPLEPLRWDAASRRFSPAGGK
jgi:hypothetical protein